MPIPTAAVKTLTVLLLTVLWMVSAEGEVQAGAAEVPSGDSAVQYVRAALDAAAASVKDGIDVNIPRNNGGTAIMHAVFGNASAVALLIHSGADVNAQDTKGRTPLMFAAMLNRTASASLLLDAGANVHATDIKGDTALSLAAANNCTTIVALLLNAGANVNALDARGGNALMKAVPKGHVAVAKMLFAAGIDVNVKGGTPLSLAVAFNSTAMVSLLLQSNATIAPQQAAIPLMIAAGNNNNIIMQQLIDTGVPINVKTASVALILAALNNNAAMVSMLLQAGLQVASVDVEGSKPQIASAMLSLCSPGTPSESSKLCAMRDAVQHAAFGELCWDRIISNLPFVWKGKEIIKQEIPIRAQM
jgi:ankyrin repeat protein